MLIEISNNALCLINYLSKIIKKKQLLYYYFIFLYFSSIKLSGFYLMLSCLYSPNVIENCKFQCLHMLRYIGKYW